MPTTNPSWTADDSPSGPLWLIHQRIDDLVHRLLEAGAGHRDEVTGLAAARDLMRVHRGWAEDGAFLAMLEDVLDDVYDLVMAVAPTWRAGNANDAHVQAYAQLVVLQVWHAKIEERVCSLCSGESARA